MTYFNRFHRQPTPSVAATLLFVLVAGCGGGSSARQPADGLLQGTVTGGRAPVAGAEVVLVEAEDIEGATSLQPLADVADSSMYRATTGVDGSFTISAPPGRYFPYVDVAPSEDRFLPGGDASHESLALSESETLSIDVTLSGRTPAGAGFVGSSRCLVCHGNLSNHSGTLHAVGLRAVGAAGTQPSALQDLSGFPEADAGLAFYADGNPADNTGPGDGYGYRVSGAEYNVLLGSDATGLYQALETLAGGVVSERLYLEAAYGGEGIYRQSYLTRLDATGAFAPPPQVASRYVLPAEFTETRGRDGRVAEVTQPGWRLFDEESWAPPAIPGGSAATIPSSEDSFDARCAGCHFNGMELERDVDGLFLAAAVSDPGGALDYDGDGVTEEINVGCEGCHGPGSVHAADPRSGGIVHPGRLAPGRATVLCGSCHIRGEGNGTIDGVGRSWYPSKNGAGGRVEFPLPGLSPAEFFGTSDGSGILPSFGTRGGFFDPIDLATDEGSWRDRSDGFGAERDHARLSMEHYFDHTRSRHSSNAYQILRCWDCHDVHRRERRGQVREPVEDNLLCWRCHGGYGDFAVVTDEMVEELQASGKTSTEMATAAHEHQRDRTFELVRVSMNLAPSVYLNPQGEDQLGRCITCHMPRTARSGSTVVDADGFTIRGDLASHTFDMISPEVSEAQAAAGRESVPNACVECHRGVLRGSWPDYRFMPGE